MTPPDQEVWPMWHDRSETIDELASAWVQAAGEMTDLVKDRKVSTGKYAYTYADLASVLGMARPVLARHGLMLTQAAATEGNDAVVTTTILHRSGQWVTTPPVRLAAGTTPQQTGSAITYARRYSVMAALGLATEDDDGQSAAPRTSTPRAATVRTPEEGEIRKHIAGLDPDERASVVAGFRETFGCGLSDLDPDRHAEALEWVRAS
jgi:hypothetical protein